MEVHGINGKVLLACTQAGRGRPRHASIPRWHFDMVLDQQRNDAFDAAIRRAIELKTAHGKKEVHVLDMGAGTGLLAMMAARCIPQLRSRCVQYVFSCYLEARICSCTIREKFTRIKITV